MESNNKIKLSYERRQIAGQIKKARKSERENNEDTYKFHRSGKEYLYRIGGVDHLFKYLRGLSSHKLLDVGTGTGNAISVISQMPASAGFDFEVTALRNDPKLAEYFPKEKVHITGVESLNGITNGSLSGILGVNSIAYTSYPKLAIKRLDEVLVPGGVIKTTLATFGSSANHDGLVLKGPESFIHALADLGYDIFYVDHKFYPYQRFGACSNSIVLAIKPGNPNAPSAQELLTRDLEALKDDDLGYKTDYPVFNIED